MGRMICNQCRSKKFTRTSMRKTQFAKPMLSSMSSQSSFSLTNPFLAEDPVERILNDLLQVSGNPNRTRNGGYGLQQPLRQHLLHSPSPDRRNEGRQFLKWLLWGKSGIPRTASFALVPQRAVPSCQRRDMRAAPVTRIVTITATTFLTIHVARLWA